MESNAVRRVGLLADTHSAKPDGSDLPDAVLKALKGVDVIVHLGDVGRKGILERLGEVAPVWVPFGMDKGYVPVGADLPPVKVIEGAKAALGLTFNLTKPDKKVAVGDDALSFDGEVAALVKRRFKQDVPVVAFGGTHRPFCGSYDGVLFVNPGSPTMPMPGASPAVAVVDLAKTKPAAKIISL